MLRALALLLTAIVIAAVAYALAAGGNQEADNKAEVERPDAVPTLPRRGTTAAGANVPGKVSCPEEQDGGVRVGSFEHPEGVPEYEVLQREVDRREGACGMRLLVDTKARSEADLTLITRDLKARYRDYDAVSAEFTDTTVALTYNGSAVIFNTTEGALYIGYIYGAPNNRGYYASAAD